MKSLTAFLVLLAILTTTSFNVKGQLMWEPTENPAEVEFRYEDLKHFIHAMKQLEIAGDSLAVIRRLYIDKASPGLEEFIRENNVGAKNYIDLMRQKPEHYRSLIGLPELLESYEKDIRAGLSKLQSVIPGSIFLPVYYLVGFYSGLHAEPSPYGLLLAYGDPGENPHSPGNTIVHETVHVQQALTVGLEEYQSIYGAKRSLLALAIREGAARFLTELTTGEISNQQAHEYYIKHEQELIAKFKQEMNDSSAGDWMWAKPKNPEQPQQIGYVLGSKIVQAYYDNAEDKSRAIQEILSVTDYPSFWEKSRFGQ
jgi:hypothetical protein